MRPPPINTNGNDYRNDRLEFIIEEIQKFDIVNFQEIFSRFTSRKTRLIKAAKTKGFSYTCRPPGPPCCSLYAIDSGLLTISKRKVIASSFRPFKASCGIDGVAYKGVHFNRMIIDGVVVNVMNVHMQATYCFDYQRKYHKYINALMDQISELPAIKNSFL